MPDRDGSLLSPGRQLWTAENFAELQRTYPTTARGGAPTVWRYTNTARRVEIWRVDVRRSIRRQDWEDIARQLIQSMAPEPISVDV